MTQQDSLSIKAMSLEQTLTLMLVTFIVVVVSGILNNDDDRY